MTTSGDATASGYDLVAERYATEFGDELDHKPIDRALYGLFAELVGPGARVGDVGCGPGQISAHLATLGLRPVGVDPSHGMVEVARRRNPSLESRVGSFSELGVADGEWDGAVAAYSIIHVPEPDRPAAVANLARAVSSGGWLLLSFHVSMADHEPGSALTLEEWWDEPVQIEFHFIDPDQLIAELDSAGFTTVARTEREPVPEVEAPSRRCYLLAQRR